MNIFTTIYEGEFDSTYRSLRFSLLLQLAGANASKFECFRPVIAGLPTQKCEQERKSKFVGLFIDMLNAGVNFDSLPTGCGCEDLVGNVCSIVGAGYAELIAGIGAIETPVVQYIRTACTPIVVSEDEYTFPIPEGYALVGSYLTGTAAGVAIGYHGTEDEGGISIFLTAAPAAEDVQGSICAVFAPIEPTP